MVDVSWVWRNATQAGPVKTRGLPLPASESVPWVNRHEASIVGVGRDSSSLASWSPEVSSYEYVELRSLGSMLEPALATVCRLNAIAAEIPGFTLTADRPLEPVE